ncbi:MAG: tRNA (N6-threonylcarbamoyladenosine(37)-N6)-methyltransferase TrmO [Lachnospiraceae bacterium]|jgi:tRNA-Thr(GGU) m(6)t(6)A37 methyltransferase TsaA
MERTYSMKIIGHLHCDFPTKFGIPRQSGLIEEIEGRIIFEEEYRCQEAVRGLEGFSHIWLIWQFSQAIRENWSPTVRPPKLGGNTRMGVFATRSPFRPNAVGLSSVRLKQVEMHPKWGPILHVAGADLMDGTPIFDIKPYLPYADSHPEAAGGFTDHLQSENLTVEFPAYLLEKVQKDKQRALIKVLQQDPRPSYQQDPQRIYGFVFAGYEVHFTVENRILTVKSVTEA